VTRSHHPALPAGPPPEVLEEIGAAWERAQVLLLDGAHELHFERDPAAHRAWGELRLPGKATGLRLTATETLAIACGDPVAIPV